LAERAPEITVLMPAYDAARWLMPAVASVLAQRGPSFELLIIDDGSRDETPALLAAIRDPRVRTIRQAENRGLIAALNRGLAEARGTFIARLDADDLCKPDRLLRQHAVLSADARVVLTSGYNELISESDEHIAWSRWWFTPEAYFYLLHFRNCIGHSCVMFRRTVALDLGGYREAYKRAEDFELWGRLSRAGKLVCLPEVLVAYRIHSKSVSVREADAQTEMAARIARERLGVLLDEPIAPALARLYSERAFSCARADPRASTAPSDRAELKLAAAQFVRALEAIWRTRPDYCDGPALRRFMAVEWARRAISFRLRGVPLARPRHGLSSPGSLAEGAMRGLLDEVHAPRLSSLLPRTHP
jgi:hypothetical protein